jgi:hypothetical protein
MSAYSEEEPEEYHEGKTYWCPAVFRKLVRSLGLTRERRKMIINNICEDGPEDPEYKLIQNSDDWSWSIKKK